MMRIEWVVCDNDWKTKRISQDIDIRHLFRFRISKKTFCMSECYRFNRLTIVLNHGHVLYNALVANRCMEKDVWRLGFWKQRRNLLLKYRGFDLVQTCFACGGVKTFLSFKNSNTVDAAYCGHPRPEVHVRIIRPSLITGNLNILCI